MYPTFPSPPSGSSMQEEDDFDQFLESVKARQLSITSKGTYIVFYPTTLYFVT